ncbi:MAG TPA: type IV pilus assembly protein PilM [Candidatus Saccharimonadales bacterium]
MSQLFFKERPLIGLDISQSSAKIMALTPKKWAVSGYGSVDLDPLKTGSAGDLQGHLEVKLNELLTKHIVGKLPSHQAVVSVPTSRTFTRSLTLPREAEKDLMNAIQLEAEQYIPIAMDQLYIDYQVIAGDKASLEVLMSAVPKLQVDTVMQACKAAGIEPIVIEPSINAVARLVHEAEEGDLVTVILDIGSTATDIAILDKTIRVTGGVGVGGHNMTQAIMEELNLTHDAAHMLRTHNGLMVNPKQAAIKKALEPTLQKIVSETKKVMRYYTERLGKKAKIEQLIIVGGGSNVPGIGDYFTDNMIIAARAASPWQILDFGKLTPLSRQLKPRFITAIGLAMVNQKEVWQ